MAREETSPKMGAGHASAMFRQGIAELRAAVYAQSNVAQPAQYGIYGTKTPGEVMQDKQNDMRDPDEQPSILDKRMTPEREGEERAQESRELERD